MSKESYTRRQLRTVGILLILGILLLTVLAWGNKSLQVTNYRFESNQIPASFNNYKIVQISDLHNTEFGADNSRLIQKIADQHPDMIALTGDLIDAHKTDIDLALELARQAQSIAPTYFVTGNHEAGIGSDYSRLEEGLKQASITVLRDSTTAITRGSDHITIAGIDDPNMLDGQTDQVIKSRTVKIVPDEGFNLLLAHRPENLPQYAESGAELALTGHAHGGQIRLPLIGGLVAPNQGFLPAYDAGTYQEGETKMVLSRGLGNSLLPVRINNRPEVTVITLNAQ